MSVFTKYSFRRGIKPSINTVDASYIASLMRSSIYGEPSATLVSLIADRQNTVTSTLRISPELNQLADELAEQHNVPKMYILGAVFTYLSAPKLVPDYALRINGDLASVALWVSDGALFVYATYAVNAQDPTSTRHVFFWHEIDAEVKKTLSYSIIHTINYIARSVKDKLPKMGVNQSIANSASSMISGAAIWLKHYEVVRDVVIGDYVFDVVKHGGGTYLYSGLRLEPAPAIDQRLERVMSKVFNAVGPSVLHARAIPTLVAAHPEVLRRAFSRDWWYAVLPLGEGEHALFLTYDDVCVSRSGAWTTRSDQECVLEVKCSEPYVRAVRQAEITSDVIHSALVWLIIRARLGQCNPDMYMAVRQISRLIAGQNAAQPTLNG